MKTERVETTVRSDRWSYLWLVIGTTLLALSTGQSSVAFAAWVAPVFLIRFFRSHRVLRGYLLLLLGLYVGYAVAWRSAMSFDPFQQWIPYLLLVVLMALNGSLPLLADRLLAPRLKGFTATFVYPLAAVVTWYLYCLASPLGSFGAAGYEQFSNRALIQLVSVTGLWGLTFLVSWLGPVVNWAWEQSFDWPRIRRGVAAFACVVALVLLFGGLRLSFMLPEAGTVRAHGISLDEEVQGVAPEDLYTNEATFRRVGQRFSDLYFEATIREAQTGARIVLWPEKATGVTGEDEDAFLSRAKDVARQEGIYLAMGVDIRFFDDDREPENRLIVIDPSGEIIINHLKYGAASISGIAQGEYILQTADTPYGTLTGIICWDADFPSTVNQAGRKGADILLVANSEPIEAQAQIHAGQAVFRAIENGVALVRQDAAYGWSVTTDPYGRVLAAVHNRRTGERVMVAQVPTHRVFTLYSVIGDLFAWLCVAGFVGIVVWAIVGGRRARSANPAS